MLHVRAALFLVGLAACGFEHGQFVGPGPGSDGDPDGGGGSDDANVTPGIDAPACAWSYTPTNFDPCALPAPGSLTVSSSDTLDTQTTPLPKLVLDQSDGTSITVIHLSQLTVDPLVTLTLTGTGVVFAVDGEVHINGTIVVEAGADDATHCAASRGENGDDSDDSDSGGGGGGGGAASADGGDGGSGNGAEAGAKGAKGAKVSSTLSPLRGGCAGGDGGRREEEGTAAAGGRGGGALQISTNRKITIAGFLDAAGRGGAGAPSARSGAGGGGSGGAIFLEGPRIELGFASRVCADGGSGGEGGGATVAGNNGRPGACTSLGAAQTQNMMNSVGGDGGAGGWLLSVKGANAQSATSGGGGGGGGGGAAGWIRLESPDVSNSGAAVTPAAMN
jgi:hypothetical protein